MGILDGLPSEGERLSVRLNVLCFTEVEAGRACVCLCGRGGKRERRALLRSL